MFSNYYNCPKDYRKHPLLIVGEIIGRIIGTIMAVTLVVGFILYIL